MHRLGYDHHRSKVTSASLTSIDQHRYSRESILQYCRPRCLRRRCVVFRIVVVLGLVFNVFDIVVVFAIVANRGFILGLRILLVNDTGTLVVLTVSASGLVITVFASILVYCFCYYSRNRNIKFSFMFLFS